MNVDPLPEGYVLADRFEIRELLGQGGFGIAYRAFDRHRQDAVVVKELAPIGSRRLKNGVLELNTGTMSAQLLRQRFTDEANRMGKLNVPGVLPVRAVFGENGTAYYATEFVANTRTLDHILRQQSRLDISKAVAIFQSQLNILEAVHRQGLLHRDIKPSNLLVKPDDRVILIDFGAAREFLSDSHATHTVIYTPGYAPPEQLSERARRGPFTDLFAACATMYHMLTGRPPEDAADRTAGAALTEVTALRPDCPADLAAAVMAGLCLASAERPQNVAELRSLLRASADEPGHRDVHELDCLLARSKSFTFQKRACPACQGILDEPRPLKRMQCPVCRRGLIRPRTINADLCPVCRTGPLKAYSNRESLQICPACRGGHLTYHRMALLGNRRIARCPDCHAEFLADKGTLTDSKSGESLSAEAWLTKIARTEDVMICRECAAQFDVLADGRWAPVTPPPTKHPTPMFPEEWARVAAGLPPSVGNAACDYCHADYFYEHDRLTLLDLTEDPYDYGDAFLGRITDLETVRWLGSGKTSPHPGLVCESCTTEFDRDGQYLRLVHSPSKPLGRHQGEPHLMEDWHRIAAGIPTLDAESTLERELDESLLEGYESGDLGFDPAGEISWRGNATLEGGNAGVLTITASEVTFGGVIRKTRHPRDAVLLAEGQGNTLRLRLSGSRDPLVFELEPVTVTFQLTSGARELDLDAEDLANRLNR